MGTTDEQRNELEALCAAAQAEDQLLAAHVAWLRQRDAAIEAHRRTRANWFHPLRRRPSAEGRGDDTIER